jgi:hypothetical protein
MALIDVEMEKVVHDPHYAEKNHLEHHGIELFFTTTIVLGDL